MEQKSKKIKEEEAEIIEEGFNENEVVAKLKKALAQCREEKEDYLKGWQRAKADYINSQRAMSEKEAKIADRAEEKIICETLGFVDSFDAAFSKSPPDDPWIAGIRQIYDNIRAFLKKYGVEAIESKGKHFTPHLHEAVQIEETDDIKKDGIVIDEIQKGYVKNKEVIRPAKVKVVKHNNNK